MSTNAIKDLKISDSLSLSSSGHLWLGGTITHNQGNGTTRSVNYGTGSYHGEGYSSDFTGKSLSASSSAWGSVQTFGTLKNLPNGYYLIIGHAVIPGISGGGSGCTGIRVTLNSSAIDQVVKLHNYNRYMFLNTMRVAYLTSTDTLELKGFSHSARSGITGYLRVRRIR